MADDRKTKKELLKEVKQLRSQLAAAELLHRDEMQKLEAECKLAKLQAESKELQSLPSTVQDQTEGLQSAHEKLTIQAEELRAANEELTILNKHLEEQKQKLEHLARELEIERTTLKAILEQMPAGVVIVKAPAGPILMSNQRAEKIFGQLKGVVTELETFLQIPRYTPDGRAYQKEELPLWRSLNLGEVVIDEEIVLRPQDVTPVHLSVSSAPVWDNKGHLVAGVVTHFDITERKRAEESLRESREDLNRAQAVGQIGSWRLDVRRNELIWSDETYRIFGLPLGAPLTYEAFLAAVHPEDRQYVDQKWNAALGGTPYDIEHRIIVDDHVKWVREKAELEFDPEGRLLGGFGTVQDITDRQEFAAALQQSHQRLDLLAETAGQLLASSSPQQVVDSLCSKVMNFLDCQAFFNFLVDEDAGRLHLNACAGIPEEEAKRIEWLDYGVAVCGCAARDGCRIVSEHIQTAPDPRTELVKSYGIRAYACHPLIRQGRVLGTLSFGTRTRDRFTPDDLALMKAVADQVAVAIDRKLAEEALKVSEERERARAAELQAILDAVPAFIWLAHDPSARVITGNSAAYELLRIPVGENMSKGAPEGVLPAHFQIMKNGSDIPFQELPVQRAAAGQMIRGSEVDVVFDDGTTYNLLGNAVPLLDSTGQPRGSVAAFIDVTARKQAEAALRQAHDDLELRIQERTKELRDAVAQLIEEVQERQRAEESLRKQAELLELAQEAIIVRDLDSRITYWNRGAEEVYGWKREKVLNQIPHELLKTRFPTSWEEIEQNLLQTGQWQGELVHTRIDGKEIIIASRMALQRDEREQPVAILEINRDVTDRRQTEETLKTERQRLLAVLERIPAYVALISPECNIPYANREFIKRFGDPGNRRCYEFLFGLDEPCEGCQALKVLRTNNPEIWEWTGPDRNTYQIYDYPFIDTDGSPLILEMGVDITSRKQAEEQVSKISRMYRMLSKANETIVRVSTKEELFRQICRIMMEEGDFLLAWIGLVNPETRLIKAATQYDLNDEYIQNITIPIDDVPEGRGPTGTAVREGRYDICNDIEEDPRMAPWREPAMARGFRSSAAFPLRVGSEVVGTLTVYAGRPGFFTGDEIALLESLADDLSFALEFLDSDAQRRLMEAVLRESEERLRHLASRLLHAQESERRRLALELHDSLGQSLMVLKMQLRAIEKTVPRDQWRTREECANSLTYLNGVVDNIRRLARNLRPSVLDDVGLSAGLRVLAEEFRKYHEVELFLKMDDIEGLFSPDEEINIYRIFQETLTNIGKHAEARQVHMVIRRQTEGVLFQVTDDGIGFDLAQASARAAKKGLGLAALEERVRILGGLLKIKAQKNLGTDISFTVPYPKTG